VGLTLVEPLPEAEVKLPGVIAIVVAPAVAQLRVLLVPEFTLVGFAAKDVMVGLGGGGGVVPGLTLAQLARPRQASSTRINPRRMRIGGRDSWWLWMVPLVESMVSKCRSSLGIGEMSLATPEFARLLA